MIFHVSCRNYWGSLIAFVICGKSEELGFLIVEAVKLGPVTQSTKNLTSHLNYSCVKPRLQCPVFLLLRFKYSIISR